jgi:predicted phage terminase large subunit-like protein
MTQLPDTLPSLEEMQAELELRDLVGFVPRVSPKLMAPQHLAPLLRRFELAVEGVPQRVCCSAPPRFAKTESVLHVPAFALRRRPELTLSYSTYGDRLSRKGSRRARAITRATGIPTKGSVNEWYTEEGGGLLAGGVGGPLTGYGVNIALVDDPVKNRLEAESAIYRAKLSDWMRDVLMTRIEPNGSIFVFMTRWHPNDLIGELQGEGFEYLNLAALGRWVDGQWVPDAEEGESLWPGRWPTAALKKKFEEVGAFTSASLYQGQPRARGDRVFHDAHVWAQQPIIYRPAGGVDAAYSQKKTADYSAYVKMLRAGDFYYVTDATRVREPAPMFQQRLRVVHDAEPTMRWRWYVATSELGAASFFAEGDNAVPLHGDVAKADKFIRALRYAAAWNAGKVLVPQSAPWLDDFLAEHAGFTGVNDKRDDYIDAAVAAFDELSETTAPGPLAAPPRPNNDSM